MISPYQHNKQEGEKVSEESKNSAIKLLAIVGSIAVIVLGVWLVVQVIQVLPSTFSSLSSMAEDVYSGRSETNLEVVSDMEVVNSGETFTVSWNKLERDGSFVFNYVCADGVAVDVRANGEITSNVSCVSGLTLPAETTAIDVIVSSEKNRFIDLEYSLTFTEEGDEESSALRNGTITVVNAGLPSDDEVAVADEDEESENTTTDETDEHDTYEETNEDTATTRTTPTPTPEPRTRTVTYIPISNPNGYTDLQISVLATGSMRGRIFIPAIVADADDDAAIVVEVKNIGTKTSERWDLDIELPNGEDFTLNNEKGLRPNEREILTIQFDASDLDGHESFEGRVDVDQDFFSANDRFRGVMRFRD